MLILVISQETHTSGWARAAPRGHSEDRAGLSENISTRWAQPTAAPDWVFKSLLRPIHTFYRVLLLFAFGQKNRIFMQHLFSLVLRLFLPGFRQYTLAFGSMLVEQLQFRIGGSSEIYLERYSKHLLHVWLNSQLAQLLKINTKQ